MEAPGAVSLPSRSFLAASVALGALAAGIAFLLYRYPLLLVLVDVNGGLERKAVEDSSVVTFVESMGVVPRSLPVLCSGGLPQNHFQQFAFKSLMLSIGAPLLSLAWCCSKGI